MKLGDFLKKERERKKMALNDVATTLGISPGPVSGDGVRRLASRRMGDYS